jgi:cellulose synthase/poly-beta-1,6-N-acetylglucosamine synthase-like glycosyltransferase
MPISVSVVLPVWNAESTVERAIRSILQQSLSSFELIVVDDGSSDQTPNILTQISDERLHVVRTEHQGVAAAANVGTQHTQATIIARMDADDIAHPDRLACQLKYLQDYNLDVVGSRIHIASTAVALTAGMKRYERWINEETATTQQIHSLRFVELPLVNPSIMATRAYFQMGFADNDFPEDYDLMLRAVELGMKCGKTPEALLTWTDSPNRLTRTNARYTDDAFMDCRRFHLLNGPLNEATTVDLWGAGQTGKPWLRWLQNQMLTVREVIDVSKRKQGQTIHNVPVIAPENIAPPDGTPMIVAVGADGARRLIADFVTDRGYQVGRDVWFVA